MIRIAPVALAALACPVGAGAEERDPGSSVSRDYQLASFATGGGCRLPG